MSIKRKKAVESSVSKSKKKLESPANSFLKNNQSLANKSNSLKNNISKIETFVSKEIEKYDYKSLRSKNILYLGKHQLIENTEKNLGKFEVNMSELKDIIRAIVIEELDRKSKK